jgi:hypothetical protein
VGFIDSPSTTMGVKKKERIINTKTTATIMDLTHSNVSLFFLVITCPPLIFVQVYILILPQVLRYLLFFFHKPALYLNKKKPPYLAAVLEKKLTIR